MQTGRRGSANRCNAEGYESVALVPLRVGEETLGLLQLNAIRPDRFTLETVEIWERLADHLAVAVAKFEAEEALRESERRFRSVLEDSLDCIYRLNLQTGRFEYVSPSAETIVGYGPNELMAQNTGESMDMVHPDDLPVMQAARERLEATGQVNAEYRQRTKNGEYRWLSNHMSLVRDIEGLPLYRNGSIRDVTEQKQAEEELIRQSEKLEAANRELDSFAYSVSHDLRAPLRAIDGYSRMVLKKLGDNLAGEAKEDFAVIRDSVRAMDRLIDDLLAFSRQGRQSMNLGPLDMRLLLWETWQELRSANRERTMTLNIESVPSGWGDKALLKQVFMNLLTNAVKFTRNREDGRIDAGGYEQGGEIVYYVKDNGVGFDMRFQEKLFGVFQRLHSSSEYEGTGIGLALVQRIVHRHGGRVWAEGKVNEGATFYFTLPYRMADS